MRLLHTSDWHLGASHDGLSLLPEQERFLAWLATLLVEESVDALLVSGDIFDQAHPSAEAQRAWYRFLASVQGGARPCTVVVTAGNHDSPSRLAAPSALLDALDVRVVGSFPPDGDIEPLLHPLRTPEGSVAAVVAAVPYVHEYRLGVRAVDHADGGLREAMIGAFGGLYRTLAARARERFGEAVPLVAMGHLTVGGPGEVDPDDAPQTIHQIGTIDALPPSIFGPEWAYVALGHLHGAWPVGSRRCWYSGTPVAIRPREGEHPRRVRLLDLHASPQAPEGAADGAWEEVPGGWARQQDRRVPTWRTLRAFRGTEEEVVQAVEDAEIAPDLPPAFVLRVAVPAWEPALEDRVRSAVQARWSAPQAPAQLKVIQERIRAEEAPEARDVPALDTLGTEEVFRLLYRYRSGHDELPERLVVAFREVMEAEVDP